MDRYNDYGDEFARADAREKELQRQMNMRDGISSNGGSNSYSYGAGYDRNYDQGFNSYGSYPSFNCYQNNGVQASGFAAGGVYYVNQDRGDLRSKKKAYGILTIVFIGIAAIVFTVMMLIVGGMRKEYKRCTVDAEAVVVDNEVESKYDDDFDIHYTYYPVMRYEFGGKQYTKTSREGEYPAKYTVGQKVNIHINPDDPSKFYINNDEAVVIASLSIISGGFLLIALMFMVMFIKLRKKIQMLTNS